MDAFTWILILVGAVVILWVFLMGDVMSTLVLLLVAAIIIFVLLYFGFVTVTSKDNNLDITFNPSAAPKSARPWQRRATSPRPPARARGP